MSGDHIRVTVAQGILEGHQRRLLLHPEVNCTDNTVAEFLGVPYAKPPVEELRYEKPQDLPHWEGVREAHCLGNASPQTIVRYFTGNAEGGFHEGEELWNPREKQSEDCLYLNIWAPWSDFPGRDESKSELLPVMVWIHGGSFEYGSAGLDVYNGAVLALLGRVVVVGVNYRLGSLGFFKGPSCSNQGLWDQCHALRWVQDNIQQFGGDPMNVCLFGESAGSVSVSFHVLSDHSRNLFHKAILQSGTALAEWALQSTPANPKSETPLLHCPWAPSVDGDFVKGNPLDLLKLGEFHHCPLMMGINSDEGTYFVLYASDLPEFPATEDKNGCRPVISEERLKTILSRIHGIDPTDRNLVDQMVQLYSAPEQMSPEKIILQSLHDRYFATDLDSWVDLWCQHADPSKSPLFLYQFGYRSSNNHPWPEWCGVMHGDEIFYVFGLPLLHSERDKSSKKDREISLDMIQLWSSFSRNGCPQSGDVQGQPVNQIKSFVHFDVNQHHGLRRCHGNGPFYSKKAAEFWRNFPNRRKTMEK